MTRLASIGAADVPGYLWLIEADEGTLARLGSLPHCLIDPKLARLKRRPLETAGAVEAAPSAAG